MKVKKWTNFKKEVLGAFLVTMPRVLPGKVFIKISSAIYNIEKGPRVGEQ